MAPAKKKARKSTDSADPKSPQDIVSSVREKIGNNLKKKRGLRKKRGGSAANYDVEHNIRTIKAILAINKEIWERCEGSMEEGNGTNTTFVRIGFTSVKTQHNNQNNNIQFIAVATKAEKSFRTVPIASLPSQLSEIFQPTFESGSKFVKFEAYFKKSLILNDEVLGPFLAMLKDHLESVQVCLGKIDAWLMATSSSAEFLESTFGTKLNIPDETAFNPKPPSPYDVCMNCGHTLSNHHIKPYGSSFNVSKPLSDYECPDYSGQTFRNKSSDPPSQVLKTFSMSGKVELTFDVAIESEQTKLKKFLEFASS